MRYWFHLLKDESTFGTSRKSLTTLDERCSVSQTSNSTIGTFGFIKETSQRDQQNQWILFWTLYQMQQKVNTNLFILWLIHIMKVLSWQKHFIKRKSNVSSVAHMTGHQVYSQSFFEIIWKKAVSTLLTTGFLLLIVLVHSSLFAYNSLASEYLSFLFFSPSHFAIVLFSVSNPHYYMFVIQPPLSIVFPITSHPATPLYPPLMCWNLLLSSFFPFALFFSL